MMVKFGIVLLLLKLSFISAELKNIVDLTWDFSNDTIYWQGIKSFSYTKMVADDTRGYWYSMNEFCAGEHGGTHFDAPYHFNKEGWKVADVPVDRLIAKGATIDLSQNETKALLPKHLENWVRQNGQFDANTVLIIKFGRSKYWNNRNEYMGIDVNGNMNFPGISPEAATWIANSGKIVGVGLDSPSVDTGDNSDMMTHRILSKNQIYNLENVKLLDDLPVKGFTVLVLPMKLKDGTGAPVRILAVPKNYL